MDRIPMTAAGLERLQEELKRLKNVDRPNVIQAIAEAREHGDLSENAEYHAAKERQGWIEAQINEIESQVGLAQVIDVSTLSGDTVKFGATVTLVDIETDEEFKYQIVGQVESDIKQGRLSITSPIARALIGKREGDEIDVATPGGRKQYEVLQVEFV